MGLSKNAMDQIITVKIIMAQQFIMIWLLHPQFCVVIFVKIMAQFSRTCSVLLCVVCYKAQLISCNNMELWYHIGLIGYINMYLFRLVLIKEVWI